MISMLKLEVKIGRNEFKAEGDKDAIEKLHKAFLENVAQERYYIPLIMPAKEKESKGKD